MRIVITRPQADGERTAAQLEAIGHEVLLAPLLQVEAIAANLSGPWSAVAATSANAIAAIAENPGQPALLTLPFFAVGAHTAEAARAAGFVQVVSAEGDAQALVQLIVERLPRRTAPLLYLAGEQRAADVEGALAAHGIAAKMRVVYRARGLPFPPELSAALASEDVDAVLHFSRRSCEQYLAGAREADVLQPALDVRHYCLSVQVAAPLRAAGAEQVASAQRPSEAELLALLPRPRG